ncbi:MAG: hypothetical protein INQ03_12315 [Candidatus Heimdallarchaeota archaeon]|nr:hypothetical protein [Candidatus Heimdallarchaeota archaeon]
MSDALICSKCQAANETSASICKECGAAFGVDVDIEMPDVSLDGFDPDAMPEMPDVAFDGFDPDAMPDMPDVAFDGFDTDVKDPTDSASDLDFLDSSTPEKTSKVSAADLDFLDDAVSKSKPSSEDLDFLDDVRTSEPKKASAADLDFLDSVVSDSESKEHKVSSSDLDFLDSVSEEAIPDMPDFDEIPDFDMDDDEAIFSDELKPTIKAMGTFKLIAFLAPQWIYWSIIFLLLSFASLDLVNPNLNAFNLDYFVDYQYNKIFLLFAWISFIPMGFFLRFKLQSKEHPHTLKTLFLFVVGQLIILSILSYLVVILLNPQVLSNIHNRSLYFISSFFLFAPTNFIISFLSFGVLGIYLGYNTFYDGIFKISPASKNMAT